MHSEQSRNVPDTVALTTQGIPPGLETATPAVGLQAGHRSSEPLVSCGAANGTFATPFKDRCRTMEGTNYAPVPGPAPGGCP